MARLGVPIVTCVIGEGGSGGAIATALADRVLMQENAIYTVISPEGCAAILWRDAGEAKKAAAAFKPDAVHCLELGVIDGIVPEPAGGAHTNHDAAARLLGESLQEALDDLESVSPEDLKRRRRAKVRSRGVEDLAIRFALWKEGRFAEVPADSWRGECRLSTTSTAFSPDPRTTSGRKTGPKSRPPAGWRSLSKNKSMPLKE